MTIVADMLSTSPAERELMRHALGIDPLEKRSPKRGGKPRNVREHDANNHRNYFAASPGDMAWEGLVARGLAKRGRWINDPPHELQYYHVTETGKTSLL